MKPVLTSIVLIASVVGVSLTANAMPDARKRVPQIKIPVMEDGRALPVEFIASDRGNDEIYVKPLEGILKSKESVLTDAKSSNFERTCIEIADLFEARRNLRALYIEIGKRIQADTAEMIRLEESTKQLYAIRVPLANQVAIYDKEIKDYEKQSSDLKTEIDTQEGKRSELKGKISRADDAGDKPLAESLRAELVVVLAKIRKAENQIEDLDAKRLRIKGQVRTIEHKLAEIDGEIDQVDTAMLKIRQRRTANEEDIAKSTLTFENILKSHSTESAGYMKLTMDFAPAEWLQRLSKENDGRYTFVYVPSLAATIDVTFPAVKPDSPMAKSIGNFILDQHWTDAGHAWMENPLFKKIIESGFSSVDPKSADFMQKLQEIMQAYSDDLSGLKELTFQMSNFGACALVFPEKYPSDMNATGSVFALNMYYNYPIKYDIHVTGTHSINKTLYEFYKRSSSSSWFGLKKKQRQEFQRDITSDEFIKIKVDSSSPNFHQDDAEALRQEVADQLAFDAVKDYMDYTKPAPDAKFGDINASRPLNSIGSKLMLFKVSPWTFWGGFALKTLDSLLGSSSNTSENRQSLHMANKVDFTEVFSAQRSGSITVGSYKATDFDK